MGVEETAEKATNLLAKYPYPAFIVILLAISGGVYYFIIISQLKDIINQRDLCQKENKDLYQLIIQSQIIINKQSEVIEVQSVIKNDSLKVK